MKPLEGMEGYNICFVEKWVWNEEQKHRRKIAANLLVMIVADVVAIY